MARPKEFDTDLALDRAMDLFWRCGYEATSTRDLTEELAIGQGSLYGTFGSKDELYRRALERYCERHAAGLLERLDTDDDVRSVLREVLVDLAEADLTDPARRGCLLVNAATERPGDESTGRRVGATMGQIETALRTALERARARGELSASKDPTQIARVLTTFIQGLRVMGKARASRPFVTDAIDGTLTILD